MRTLRSLERYLIWRDFPSKRYNTLILTTFITADCVIIGAILICICLNFSGTFDSKLVTGGVRQYVTVERPVGSDKPVHIDRKLMLNCICECFYLLLSVQHGVLFVAFRPDFLFVV